MTVNRIPERYRIPREDGGTISEFYYPYMGETKRALVYLPHEAFSDPARRFPTRFPTSTRRYTSRRASRWQPTPT